MENEMNINIDFREKLKLANILEDEKYLYHFISLALLILLDIYAYQAGKVYFIICSLAIASFMILYSYFGFLKYSKLFNDIINDTKLHELYKKFHILEDKTFEESLKRADNKDDEEILYDILALNQSIQKITIIKKLYIFTGIMFLIVVNIDFFLI